MPTQLGKVLMVYMIPRQCLGVDGSVFQGYKGFVVTLTLVIPRFILMGNTSKRRQLGNCPWALRCSFRNWYHRRAPNSGGVPLC